MLATAAADLELLGELLLDLFELGVGALEVEFAVELDWLAAVGAWGLLVALRSARLLAW